MPNEPNITINGVKLTQGQAMTMRVALESFAMNMQEIIDTAEVDEDIKIQHAYMACVRDIRAIYLPMRGNDGPET